MTGHVLFPCAGPEEAGSGRYGPQYITSMGVSEDDDGSEDELDLDVSFEEVPSPLLSPPMCFVSLLNTAA